MENFTDQIRNIKPGESREFIVKGYDLLSKRQLVSRLNTCYGMKLSTTYNKETQTLTVTNNG